MPHTGLKDRGAGRRTPESVAPDVGLKARACVIAMRLAGVRSAWLLASMLRQIAGATPLKASERFDELYKTRTDPWDFTRPEEQARHRLATEVLDKVRGPGIFRRALEVGCGAGVFTEMLTERCEHLLAVDVSSIALERARSRRQWGGGVEFRVMNLPLDPVPGDFDLVVAMEVLPLIRRRWDLRAARDRLVGALADGGHLLIQNHKGYGVADLGWWTDWLVQGSVAIDRFVSRHPTLEVELRIEGEDRILTLFRKRAH